jgi:uncharacterized protein YdeI (YjbR/CyaY-like superfamily)
MEPTYFASPDEFRAWLDAHHATEREILVGYHKVGTARPSMTWAQSVDQALCYGWIDGVRRRVDDERYTIRFTPRKPRSIWSDVNVRRVGELTEMGLMQPAGLAAFAAREAARSGVYSFEQAEVAFTPEMEARFREDAAAWAYFQAQAPSYRRAATWWVIQAKRPETRERRLTTLIADSAAGRWIPPMLSAAPKKSRPKE